MLENGGYRINRNPLCLIFTDGIVDSLDQAREIKTAGHVLAFRIRRSIKNKQLILLNHALKIPAKTSRIAQYIQRRFLKCHKNARLVVLADPVVEKIERENRLAGAGSAADQGGAANGQAPMADIIEALDPSRELLNLHQGITGGAWFLHRQLGSD